MAPPSTSLRGLDIFGAYVGGNIEAKPRIVPNSIAVAHPVQQTENNNGRGVRRKKNTESSTSACACEGWGTCGEHSAKGDDEVNGIGDTVKVDEGDHDLHDHVDRETDNNLFSGKNTHHPPPEKAGQRSGKNNDKEGHLKCCLKEGRRVPGR